MFRKPLIVLMLLCLPAYVVFSQQRQGQGPRRDISGKVVDSTDNQPMPMVQVGISELTHWTVTDMEGNFTLRNVPAGKHVLTIRCLGYTLVEREFSVPEETEVSIKLTPASLALGEVVVTAQRGTGISTSTTIGRSAIEHTQPSSITDIMQLLPGEVSANPNLTGVNQLSIREVTGGNLKSERPRSMASLGTGLRIDGAPVSNTANMQSLSWAGGGGGDYQTTAGEGVDMRQFPVDNIESIEVIRGIPGVEEGNVLSGVVNISLIKGATPWTTRIKVDPNIKQAYVGKGVNLPGDLGGTLNMDVDFQQSIANIRYPYSSFNRFSGYFAYNNTFFKESRPLVLMFSTRYYDQRNRRVDDPDRLRQESLTSQDNTLALTVSGRWALNSKLLTNLNWNISGNIQSQNTAEIKFRNLQSVQATPNTLFMGEHEGIFLRSAYYSDVTVEGRPRYYNARLNGTKTFDIGQSQHTLRAGMDYSYSVNKGRGSMFDTSLPPTGSYRPRPFNEIPANVNLAFFIGEELKLSIGTTQLDLHIGVRFENNQPDGLFSSSEGLTSLDPRFNAKYQIISNKDRFLSNLGIRFGFGRSTLTPPLRYIYPDKAYFDFNSFNYYDPPGALTVITTHVIDDIRNYNLQNASSKKLESGLDIKLGRIDMQFTAYYEEELNGFSAHSRYFPVEYNKYASLPLPGLAPAYVPGEGVMYNDPVSGDPVYLSYETERLLRSHSYPENGSNYTKYGIEAELDFGRVELIQTSFILGSAYRYTHRQDIKDFYSTDTSVRDQVVGLYPAGEAGRYDDRITSTLRTITHIKPLAMVVSLTMQAIWIERYQNTYEDENGNILVYTLEPTDDIYGDISQRKYYNPIAVMDLSGELKPWLPEYADIMPYAALIKDKGNETYVPYYYKPTFQLNMRLTKELSQNATISFSVNNLTYYRPLQRTMGRVNETFSRRNSDTYFSGELTIKI